MNEDLIDEDDVIMRHPDHDFVGGAAAAAHQQQQQEQQPDHMMDENMMIAGAGGGGGGGGVGGANNNINNNNINNNLNVNPFLAAGTRRMGLNAGAGSSSPVHQALFQEDRQQCMKWSRVTVNGGTVPPPRSGAASVIVKGKMYVFGGYGGGTGRLDDFYAFDFDSGVWEEVRVLSEEKPGRRENNGVVISDSNQNIALFGGYNGHAWLNDLWKFDIDSRRWTCIQESSDQSRAVDESNAAVGEAAVGSLANGSAVNNVVLQNDANNNLMIPNNVPANQVKGKIPSRRFGYVSVVHAGKFVLFGGFDGQRWLNDMYVFHFATKTWIEIQAKGNLPSARSCPAWAKDSQYVYVHGGYDGVERKADFFALDLATYTWTEMPCLGTPPSPRYFHSCCLYGHKMYLYAGYSGHERLADMYAYDFETSHWSEVDCTRGEVPSGRSSLVAQVHQNCLYVFSGYSGRTVLNDFYKFRLKPIGVPPPALVSDFARLINCSELADVKFLVDGKEVFAHRAILAIRSEYFRVMLCGGMRESTHYASSSSHHKHLITASSTGGGSSDDHGSQIVAAAGGAASRNSQSGFDAIELPDVSHTVFLKVLEFLYTDTVRDVSLEIGIHLLIASELFMLDRLKALCEDLIRRDIHVSNVVHILVASHRHNAAGLKDIALEFILRHLNHPTVFAGLSDLRSEPDLLLEIIKRNSGPQQQEQQPQQNAQASANGGSSASGGAGQGNQDYSAAVGPYGGASNNWAAGRRGF